MPPDAPRHDDGRRGADCFGGEILRRYRQHVLERYGFRTAPRALHCMTTRPPGFAYAVEAPGDPPPRLVRVPDAHRGLDPRHGQSPNPPGGLGQRF
jgi:hypothetical protein